jgi:hypothetical protein
VHFKPCKKYNMLRRSFIKTAGLIAGLINLPFFNLNAQNPMKKTNFRHVVYFWLNEPENNSQRKQFIANLKEFIGKMENDFIVEAYIGVPADTNREVVDNTYQYCLNLRFENRAQHDVYQEHPFHKQFIDKSVHLWKRVLVYDSVSI